MKWTAVPSRSVPPGRWGHAVVRWGGHLLAVAGAVLCVLGWYGVSGERFAERQIPYLASSTIPGAALIVAGAVLASRAGSGVAAARMEELYALLVAAPGADASSSGPVAVSTGPPVTVPGGTMYHRPDCPLTEGKATSEVTGPDSVGEGGLAPCPVCEPDV